MIAGLDYRPEESMLEMVYVLDYSFVGWHDILRLARPISDADGCLVLDNAEPDKLVSIRGDGLVVYYADRGVLRVTPRDRWILMLTEVDPEERFLVAMQSAQMDAFQNLMEQVSHITGHPLGEYLWDVPAAIELLEQQGSALVPYLRECRPFPFVEGADIKIWPFLRLSGDNMPSIHIYEYGR